MRSLRLLAVLIGAFSLMAVQARAELTWGQDYTAALKQAAKEDKLVLLYFSGSTWCVPCLIMDKKVLSTEKFADFAEQNLVLMQIDAVSPGQLAPGKFLDQHEYLAERLQANSVPTFFLINGKGRILGGQQGVFTQSPEGFIKWVKAVQAAGKAQ